ncbi:MAG: PQQ-binding-like beta-propeller repeat protein, partial [Capsulimonadales bacterium]|nr:PQQ-binding-like beta-propeller repeat protein [Capsulimonadales bacterium]
PSTTPRPLGRTRIAKVDGTPAVDRGANHLGADDNVIALDLDGHLRWTTETGPVRSAPLVTETVLFVGSARGLLLALDRATGSVRWKFVTDGNAGILTAPILVGDRIIFEATDNNVYALTARNGQLRWKFTRPDGSLGYASPTADRGAILVAGESTLYLLDPKTGQSPWKSFVGGKALTGPLVDGDRIIVAADGRGVNALDRTDAGVLWNFTGKSPGDWFGQPLLAGGTVYVHTYRRFTYALDARTGRFKWSARTAESSVTQPALDARRSTLYLTSDAVGDVPTLTALDAASGRKRWDAALGPIVGSPVIVEDRLLVGSTNGFLYAFGLK